MGVIGSGDIGSTVAKLFAGAGQGVAISNSRGPVSLRDLAAGIGPRAATVEVVAEFGEVVLTEKVEAQNINAVASELSGGGCGTRDEAG